MDMGIEDKNFPSELLQSSIINLFAHHNRIQELLSMGIKYELERTRIHLNFHFIGKISVIINSTQ